MTDAQRALYERLRAEVNSPSYVPPVPDDASRQAAEVEARAETMQSYRDAGLGLEAYFVDAATTIKEIE